MRILYVFDSPVPETGADTEQLVNTVAALARQGLDLALLVPGPVTGPGDPAALREYYQVEGDFAVHQLALRWKGLRGPVKWSHALRAARHPATRVADLVYCRNLPVAWALLRAGHRVVYEHFRPWGDQYPPLQPFLRAVLRHPRLLAAIFHSEHALASYRRLGVPEARMLVAHNGWAPDRMAPRLSRAEARARLGLPPDRFTVVYSGRMNTRKGLDLLLEVAAQAPEIGFVLIGSEGEGPVERAARALPNVTIVPWLRFRELAPWLYAADALIVPPSLAPLERHGNTVLPIKLFLYLAAGRVLVAPRAPDTAELLRDGVNAALVPAGDVPATVATLRAVAADPARAERLGAGALATAADLTWDARGARIAGFLARRMGEGGDALPSPDPWRVGGWLAEVGRWLLGR
ncbi:MAG: glycosyltransferase [Gemmatimonadetes bacterium]|nr:glycosyltransferase [Gemmatimonadota bacterium]